MSWAFNESEVLKLTLTLGWFFAVLNKSPTAKEEKNDKLFAILYNLASLSLFSVKAKMNKLILGAIHL